MIPKSHRFAPMLGCIALLLLAFGFPNRFSCALESSTVSNLKSAIDDAAKAFKAKEKEQAAEHINRATKILAGLLTTKMDAESFDKLKEYYPRLKKAHELLSKEGIELESLADLPKSPPNGKKAKPEPKKVSFTKQVAPLLMQNCGGCHVQGNKGDVNFASFQSLLDSPKGILHAKEPNQSPIYMMIASNQMPPRRPMNEKDKAMLRQWIEEGAEFDGKDKEKTQPMSSYVRKK